MAIKVGDNFSYKGKKPLDSRNSFDTVSEMTQFAETSLDDGHISYVKETDKYYKFNSTNDVDMTLGKWREYTAGGSTTDEKVKLDATATDAKYLNELIDNSTIEVDTAHNCLIVKKIDGQTATVAEINFLTGVKSNIQTQIDNLGKSMTMYGVFGTKADLLASVSPVPVDGNTAIVIADEDNNNKQMTYIYIASNSTWTQVAESSVTVRNFTTDPIDLATETTGTLPKSKIDIAIARLADVLDKTTYRGTGDGIVKQADKLTGLTATISALNQAVTNSHTHSNKAVLDKIVTNGIGNGFLADNGKYISILHVGTTSPLYDSQIWIDNTDSAKPILKIYDGTDWIAISGASSGGTSITVDEAMSSTSTNPVQNKVIKAYVDGKSVDISADSDNAIQTKTDGIYVEKTKISTDDGNALSKKSDGLFVEDLSNKVNALNIAQKTINEDLDYCFVGFWNNTNSEVHATCTRGVAIPFNTKFEGNLDFNSTNKAIKLKAGHRYKLHYQCKQTGTTVNANHMERFYNETTSEWLKMACNCDTEDETHTMEEIYVPTVDCEVSVRNCWCPVASFSMRVNCVNTNPDGPGLKTIDCESAFIVTEIGKTVTIDPVEYVDSTKGIEDTPVGHIIPYMGNNAPKHYLICDGGEYNIVDYPYLVQHFTDEFGSVNYFGGDGTTTFAVPDLRGEFLRGSGTNSHTNQGSGSNVGVHQDATEHINFGVNTTDKSIWFDTSTPRSGTTQISIGKTDSDLKLTTGDNTKGLYASLDPWSTSSNYSHYTARPTNTSVLYCIKYEPTYFMKNTFNTNSVYSTDEMIIGRWIDGKPLYSKMFYSENSDFATATQFPAPYAEKLVEYSPMYRNDYNNFFPESMKLYNKGQANAYFQETSRSYAGGTYWIAKYTKATD